MSLSEYFWQVASADDPCDDCTHWCEFLHSTVQLGVPTRWQLQAKAREGLIFPNGIDDLIDSQDHN